MDRINDIFAKPERVDPLPDLYSIVIEQTYQRIVYPHSSTLKGYQSGSSETYGELLPQLVAEIVNNVGVNASSLLVDLGCGVGNVLAQVAIMRNCRCYGVEIRPGIVRLAKDVLRETQARCRLWGLKSGSMEVSEGDLTQDAMSLAKIQEADLIVINNLKFDESLNQNIENILSINMKATAKAVTLRQLSYARQLRSVQVQNNGRLPSNTVFRTNAGLYLMCRDFAQGLLSWTNSSGQYYIYSKFDTTKIE
ncbi:Nucleosomal histone H3-Lys79 methylase [Stygiomarasmius scandens]|uniref:Histone-lysine N-methyltransferase, H3 lysine-79 specific n=1 Tax=Marasmiellus scandens TaxID=2682957 RepID=A0ABR1J013_9AGAR